jgi:hypothetical protein
MSKFFLCWKLILSFKWFIQNSILLSKILFTLRNNYIIMFTLELVAQTTLVNIK